MAGVYSALLARGDRSGSGTGVIYTAPATGVVVVRDIALMHIDAVVRHVAVVSLSGGVYAPILSSRIQDPYTTLNWSGRQVLLPGEQLLIDTAATTDTYYRVSGYILGL